MPNVPVAPPGLPPPFGAGSPLPFPAPPANADGGFNRLVRQFATRLPTQLAQAKRSRRAALRMLR